MATKEQMKARQARRFMADFVDRAFDQLHKEVDITRFELMRILAIAEDEHRQFARPTRYFCRPKKAGRRERRVLALASARSGL